MIEVIFDRNVDEMFLNEKRPVCQLEEKRAESWDEYRHIAREILEQYQEHPIVLLFPQQIKISVNRLAIALFAESCFKNTKTEAVVFKTENYTDALEAYKPFIALTIGLKYVIRLYQEHLKNAYKDISCLSYLGLNIKEDYVNKKLQITLNGEGTPQFLTTPTTADALKNIGILKSLALSSYHPHISTEIPMFDETEPVDIDDIIGKIVSYVLPIIDNN